MKTYRHTDIIVIIIIIIIMPRESDFYDLPITEHCITALYIGV